MWSKNGVLNVASTKRSFLKFDKTKITFNLSADVQFMCRPTVHSKFTINTAYEHPQVEENSTCLSCTPITTAAKALLIGHSAYWPDGLRTLADLGTSRYGRGFFRLDWTNGHAMRLNSRTSIEGPPVSSLNCDRSLHSG